LAPKPKKALEALEKLKKAGYNVKLLTDYVQQEVDQQDQVKQVWICTKCDFTYRSQVNLTAINCPRSHSMKLSKEY